MGFLARPRLQRTAWEGHHTGTASGLFRLSSPARWRTIGAGNHSEAFRERPVVLLNRRGIPRAGVKARTQRAGTGRRGDWKHLGLERRAGGLGGGGNVGTQERPSAGKAPPSSARVAKVRHAADRRASFSSGAIHGSSSP